MNAFGIDQSKIKKTRTTPTLTRTYLEEKNINSLPNYHQLE